MHEHKPLTKCRKDFCLKTYFYSFLKILGEKKFEDLENFILFTNRVADKKFENIGLKKSEEIPLAKINDNSECYKFSITGDQIQDLFEKVMPENNSQELKNILQYFSQDFLEQLSRKNQAKKMRGTLNLPHQAKECNTENNLREELEKLSFLDQPEEFENFWKTSNLLNLVQDSQEILENILRELLQTFLDKFTLCVKQPKNSDLTKILEEKLEGNYEKLHVFMDNFSVSTNQNKWIQKQRLFEQEGLFQGVKIQLIDILHESLYQYLDQETMVKILAKSFEIAKPKDETESMKNTDNILKNLYIERSFFLKHEIDSEKLEKLLQKEIDDAQKQENVNQAEGNTEEEVKVEFESSDKDDSKKPKETNEFIFENEECISDKTKGPKTNIHFLKREKEKIYWVKTEGNIAEVKYILTDNATRVIEKDMIGDDSNKIKLICGEPGQGKSVILSHIARSIIAQKNPKQWVAKV